MEPEKSGFVILIPVYNDWSAVSQLLGLLDAAVTAVEDPVQVILVDDGSTEGIPDTFVAAPLRAIRRVSVLRLRGNLGHQRALAIGICYIEAHVPCRAVVIMDGDGEDAPADVPRLIDRLKQGHDQRVVFAERMRRSESPAFRLFYWTYRKAHRVLTGIAVRVGNFSVIPLSMVRRLVIVPELWNHYAASVFRARLPMEMVPTSRAPRLAGQSKMNFVSLAIHGLSAISVFSDRMGVRMLVCLLCLLGVTGLGLVTTLIVKFATPLAIPGWATYAAGILLVILMQIITVLILFVFFVLRGRERAVFLPARDYEHFVSGLEVLSPARGDGARG